MNFVKTAHNCFQENMALSTSCSHMKESFMIASEVYSQRLAVYLLLIERHSSLFFQAALNLNLCFGEEICRMCLGVDESCESGNQLEETALKRLFYHHLLQLRCNSHSVSDLLECGHSGELLHCDSGEGLIQSVRPVSFGSVLLPTASLVNHSCTPNAIFRCEMILNSLP